MPKLSVSARYLLQSALILAGCLLATWLLPSLLDTQDISVTVSFLEIASLCSLVIVNHEIAQDQSKRIRYSNYFILLVTILIIVISAMEVLNAIPSRAGALGSASIWAIKSLYWVTSLPLFLFALLDALVWLAAGDDRRLRAKSRNFLLFVDVPTVTPLIFVLLLLSFRSEEGTSSTVRLFMSGATAIIILGSTLSTRAVELLLNDEMGG